MCTVRLAPLIGSFMQWEYVISGSMVIGLMLYLSYALIFPEKF